MDARCRFRFTWIVVLRFKVILGEERVGVIGIGGWYDVGFVLK